jgi:hypothetical protein
VNTEERQLAEMLHRITPEPPRRVTVEDVAFRLARDPGRARAWGREPRRRLISRRGWAPALAAARVVVIAGASAGLATVLTSHDSHEHVSGGGTPASSASQSVSSTSSSASPTQTAPAGTPLRIADGMWGAQLINRRSFDQESLTGSGDSLYAFGKGSLDRIDPATGNVLRRTPYSAPVPGRPVVLGNTVWLVWSYSGGDIVLRGYDARTLAQVASVPVPAIGGVSNQAEGVLAAGPDGKLYVAAGDTVATVDPAAGRVTHRIYLTAGQASTVAVAPDGGKIYIGTGPSGSFQLLVYDLGSGIQASSSRMSASGGNLLATSGGVWGTTGSGMSEWVWFARGGDLSSAFRVSLGAGGGLASLPSFSGGAVWIGGTHELVCASPVTGRAIVRTTIPSDQGIVRYFGSVTVLGSGRAYALYQDQRANLSGVAALTPPRACSG